MPSIHTLLLDNRVVVVRFHATHNGGNVSLIVNGHFIVIVVHSLTSGLLPGYPEPENIYIQLSHYRQRRYLLPSSLRLRLLR